MGYKIKGRYFEEFEVGEVIHTKGRTIYEGDITTFAGLTGDLNSLHMDNEYMKASPFGSIIAHGALTYSISSGLFQANGDTDGTTVAFLGVESLKFTKPVKPGDTIHVEARVANKTETSNPKRGVVSFEINTLNQKGEVVLEAKWQIMIMKKA